MASPSTTSSSRASTERATTATESPALGDTNFTPMVERPVTPVALVSAATRLLIVATPWIALLHRHLGPGGRSAKPAAAPPPVKRVSGRAG